MSENQIQIKHGTVTSMIGGGWLNLRPGQYTEETALMMEFAESLLEHKAMDVRDLVARYLKWYGGNPRDISLVTRTTLSLIQEGTPLETAGQKALDELTGDSDESAPLPWCTPLALLRCHAPERLVEETVQAVKLTHRNKKVVSGAVILNLFLSRMINGETDRRKISEQVARLVDESDFGLYDIIPDIQGKKEQDLRSSSRVQDILETSIWAVWKTKTYRDAVIKAVNLGGDADTLGAVTGALAGAYHGESAIPEEWLQKLEDRNIVAGFAKRLCKLAGSA